MIYKILNGEEILVYIGSSGQKNKDGTLKIRRGGMKDRLVNGYHPNRFGELKRIKRSKAFPKQMEIEGVTEITIYWWVINDTKNLEFPTDIEGILRNKYRSKFGKLPDWHN